MQKKSWIYYEYQDKNKNKNKQQTTNNNRYTNCYVLLLFRWFDINRLCGNV